MGRWTNEWRDEWADGPNERQASPPTSLYRNRSQYPRAPHPVFDASVTALATSTHGSSPGIVYSLTHHN